MYFRLHLWVAMGIFWFPGSLWAGSEPIVVSIKPLALIAEQLVDNNQEIQVLISGSASAHNPVLSPSVFERLAVARLVFWLGPEHEPFLAKPIARIAPQHRALLTHDDPAHAWLSPEHAREIAAQMAEELIKLRVLSVEVSRQRLEVFSQKLLQIQAGNMAKRLNSKPRRGVVVAHDAYSALLSTLGIEQLGAIADAAGHQHGVKNTLKLRQLALSGEISCVIMAPYAPNRLIDRLIQKTDIKKVIIDPLATQSRDYPQFLKGAIADLRACS